MRVFGRVHLTVMENMGTSSDGLTFEFVQKLCGLIAVHGVLSQLLPFLWRQRAQSAQNRRVDVDDREVGLCE